MSDMLMTLELFLTFDQASRGLVFEDNHPAGGSFINIYNWK